jgi:glycosyltransferase involved in cell wall biosynthesis
MAEKMLYLLNDGGKAAEIGRKARKLVEEKYSLDKVVDDLEELYIEVTSRRCS